MEDGEYRRKRDDDSDDDRETKGGNGGNKSDKKSKNNTTAGVDLEKPMEEMSPEEQEARMMATMGFGGFDSTKVKRITWGVLGTMMTLSLSLRSALF